MRAQCRPLGSEFPGKSIGVETCCIGKSPGMHAGYIQKMPEIAIEFVPCNFHDASIEPCKCCFGTICAIQVSYNNMMCPQAAS